MRAHLRGRAVVPLVAGLLFVQACGGSGATASGPTDPPRLDAPSRQASLPDGVVLATPAVSEYKGPARGLGAMGGVHPSRMEGALRRAGLDIRALPPLETLPPGPKQRVMRTFSEALGVPCLGCHAPGDDFKADTKRKRVARRMWNEIVRVVEMKDGSAVYCDSCHDGALYHLDRRNKNDVAAYMCNAMIGDMRRIDGRAHDCTTCHGDPPDFQLIASWKSLPAPVITNDASIPGVIVPQWPAETPREPSDCGPNGELCPLASYMRLVVAPAAAAEDKQALSKALSRVASWAPDLPSFAEDARLAAAAALRGDPIAVRDACGTCHKKQKAAWVRDHRRREPAPKTPAERP